MSCWPKLKFGCFVMQDFLRSLPDCVLRSDMYDNWIDILDIQEDTQRTDKVKK